MTRLQNIIRVVGLAGAMFAILIMVSLTNSAQADSWEYPSEKHSETNVFGSTKIVRVRDPADSRKYPQWSVEIYADEKLQALYKGVWFEDILALKDNSLFVGIATGLVVVGDLIGEGASQESAVVGETPNLAARLQGIADINKIAIANSTHVLAGGRFEYKDLGLNEVKGLPEPVRVWQVVAASAVQSRFEARQGSTPTAFVGREPELQTLIHCWSQAKGVTVKSYWCRASLVSANRGLRKC